MLLYIDDRRQTLEAVQDELGSDLDVQWVATLGQIERALAEAVAPVEAVILGPSVDREEALRQAERVTVTHPEVGVILLAEVVDAAALRRAIRAGVLDMLDAQRAPGELREAVDRARSRYVQLHPSEGQGVDGRLVLVFSTKGGCGKSFVASNLAVALADRLDGGVALVDLALSSGDLSIMLQLMPAWTVYDAALQGARLDHEALAGFLTQHSSGLQLLAAPNDPAVAEQVTADSVQHLLGLLRTSFPVTIVDTPAYFSDQVLAAIDLADEVVLVTSLDVPSVKNLKLALQTLQALHVPRERVRIVLNRADSSVGLRVAEVEQSLDTDIDVSIPSSRDVPLSINQGTPLYGSRNKSSVIGALGQLADLVAAEVPGAADDEEPRKRRSRGRRAR